MYIVLYRWRVRPELEQQFIDAWSERTAYFREKHDSLGSRLHRGSDGFWYSYAQWKSAEQRRLAFEAESGKNNESSQKMREAIEENLPEIELEIAADYIF